MRIILHILLVFLIAGPLAADEWKELIALSDRAVMNDKADSAEVYLNRALELAVNQSASKHAVTLSKLGLANFENGEYQKALEYFVAEQKLKASFLNENHPSYILALNNLASAYHNLGQYVTARRILNRALGINSGKGEKFDKNQSMLLHNMGKTYHILGEYEKAEESYLQAIKIKENAFGGENPSTAKSYYNLGLLYKSLGNYEESKSRIESALDIFKDNYSESAHEIYEAQLQLALVYYALGLNDEFNSLMPLIEENDFLLDDSHHDAASNFYNFGVIKWTKGQNDEALELLEKALELTEKNYGKTSALFFSCLNAIGIVHWAKGNLDKAYKYLNQVVQLRVIFFNSRHPEYASSLHNLAVLLIDMRKYGQAETYLAEALDIYIYQIENVFPFLTETERVRFYRQIKERFSLFYNFVMDRHDLNPDLVKRALEYNLKTKGLLLKSAAGLRAQIKNSGDSQLLETFDDWIDIKSKIANYYKLSIKEIEQLQINLDSLQQIAEEKEKQISGETKIIAREFFAGGINWDLADNLLKENEAFVNIIAFRDFNKTWARHNNYAAIIMTRENAANPSFVLLANSEDFEKHHFTDWRNKIESKMKDNISYRIFWEKIESEIEGKSKVYVSLDGIYNKISLNSLSLGGGKHLADEKEIVIVSDFNDISSSGAAGREFNSKKAYIFANPDYSSSKNTSAGSGDDFHKALLSGEVNVPALPASETEALNISEILEKSGWNTVLFMKDEANVSNLYGIKSPGILHIASHGFFLEGNIKISGRIGIELDKGYGNPYLRSGLILSPGSGLDEFAKYNGIITSMDVLNMGLDNPELAVLSACETGLGEIVNGEGVYGLQRAFRMAGARYILMSLWKVGDKVTSEYMNLFYSNWLSGASLNEALRKTQFQMRDKYGHPYYWAAFVLIGG